ncbi:hypothetical protein Amsp01_043190 [Amycolatopsis sp. NBRC 101858]|uniref:hypothetical protein n=1 Tax=Amycolatopsis sp. NBRC 101858 TaxID=3032200 RepID=UPI0024A4D16F|nr:hypothetical protein [Amycolatopsis sp. NBRC 101858]GLY38295.1 hypothetical protein Amsp01_043190 [Amycolatopsis sp. NBRC 101858]
MTAGTREWLDTGDVRDDLEVILAQLSGRQLRLLRRLAIPGPHPVDRTEMDEVRAVNWIAEAFWFRHPLLEVGPEGVVIAAPAANLVTGLLAARFPIKSVA